MRGWKSSCIGYVPDPSSPTDDICIEQVFRVKKLMGRRWAVPNSHYLLVMVSTLIMPFSMDPLIPRMTPGCITKKKHECIRVLNTNQEAVPKHPHLYIIGKLPIAWESALSAWMLCTG